MSNNIPLLILPFLKSKTKKLRLLTAWIFSTFLAEKDGTYTKFIYGLPGFLDSIKVILKNDENDVK